MSDKITSLAGLRKAIEELGGFNLRGETQGNYGLVERSTILKLISEFEAGVRERLKKLKEQHEADSVNVRYKQQLIDWFEHGILHGNLEELRRLLDGERGGGKEERR